LPELPEIYVIADQMNKTVKGKVVETCMSTQPKCLNKPAIEYKKNLHGKRIEKVSPLGKWIEIVFSSNMRLLVNLGMGGEICFLEKGDKEPEKSRFVLRFNDDTGFYVSFWWFGYVHLVITLEEHKMTDFLGPDPLKISSSDFEKIAGKSRGIIKNFLLNQKKIRGVGNYYAQEIFFRAGIHPLKKIENLTKDEMFRLHKAVCNVFEESISLGSSSYEKDFFGKKGRYLTEYMSVGYKEGLKCPVCGTVIQKIGTGSSSHYICPKCQSLEKWRIIEK